MKKILLSKRGGKGAGKVALVDDRDYERVSKHNWTAFNKKGSTVWYARTRIRISKGPEGRLFVQLHRFILGISDPAILVDHIDHDGLNNRRKNLRVATPQESSYNRRKVKTRTVQSSYKGVWFFNHKLSKPWAARIYPNGKSVHLGYFRTAEEAALAYNKAAKHYYGQFAKLNEVDE